MKRIAIIGGGISGLAVLHFVKQRFGAKAQVTLYERESSVGGTIRSLKKDSCVFEWGPNGFLDNQPTTLQLINEMGLEKDLITADPSARRCFIQIKGELLAVPSGIMDFIQTPLFSFKDKWSLIIGLLKWNVSKDTSIYDYVRRRFSAHIAEVLVDPLISGIYAGNIKRLHMDSTFPKLKRKGFKKSHMCSFKGGMGQLVEALRKRYELSIVTGLEISAIPMDTNITIVATPAYAAAKIIENPCPFLSPLLNQMPYAPVAVAGLLFKLDAFKKKPDGFGYLIPSSTDKDILGVLIESNVYNERAGNDEVMLRVMMGGAHHPAIINDEADQILARAIKEIDSTYGLTSNPIETFVKIWPKAIPQYEINYPQWRKAVSQECAKVPGLYLCANYLDGVSFNDCIKNAKSLSEMINI